MPVVETTTAPDAHDWNKAEYVWADDLSTVTATITCKHNAEHQVTETAEVSAVTKEATCTKEGKRQRTCTVCGEEEKESIPVIPHSFGEWEVTREATCIKEGKRERVRKGKRYHVPDADRQKTAQRKAA